MRSRPCSASAISCSTISSMATSRAFRRRRRRRCSRSGTARSRSAAPATWRAISRRWARNASWSALIGNDDAGLTLTNALGKFDGLIVPDLVIDKARQTTRKVRFVSEHHSTHLMRADWETTAPTSAQSEASIIAYAETAMPQVGAVVLSDYAKGVLTPRVIRAIIDAARRLRQTGRGRSERPRLQRLSRRDLDHAEPPGARRRGASPGRDRSGNRQGRGRSWRAWSRARRCWSPAARKA